MALSLAIAEFFMDFRSNKPKCLPSGSIASFEKQTTVFRDQSACSAILVKRGKERAAEATISTANDVRHEGQ